MANTPENLKYTKDHEWASIDESNIVTVGITDFAQSSLGDIVFVELPEVGDNLEEGSSFGVVESIKSVSDLYAPVSGEVVERNEDVLEQPEVINSDAYSSWMLKIKVEDISVMDKLLSSTDYEDFCANS